MLLAIDVGNTETKLGCFSGPKLQQTWRVTTELRRTPDEYGVFFTQLFATSALSSGAIDAVAIASVVPKLDPVLEMACERFFDAAPLFLKPHDQRLIEVATENPSEVGADLVAAAIGGRARFGAPLIVVSFGTATVFIAISRAGEYLGVAIAPGIAISIDALIGRTAKLPQIALETPRRAIGRNTVEALQSGSFMVSPGRPKRSSRGCAPRWATLRASSQPAASPKSSPSRRPSSTPSIRI